MRNSKSSAHIRGECAPADEAVGHGHALPHAALAPPNCVRRVPARQQRFTVNRHAAQDVAGKGDEGAVEGLDRRRRGAHGEGPGCRGRDTERQRCRDEPARVLENHLDDV